MGMTLSSDLLLAIYPFQISAGALRHDLKGLEDSRFLMYDELASVWNFAQASLSPPPRSMLCCRVQMRKILAAKLQFDAMFLHQYPTCL